MESEFYLFQQRYKPVPSCHWRADRFGFGQRRAFHRPFWLFLLAMRVFGALLAAQAVVARLWWHRKWQRWSGSDWVDEDDD